MGDIEIATADDGVHLVVDQVLQVHLVQQFQFLLQEPQDRYQSVLPPVVEPFQGCHNLKQNKINKEFRMDKIKNYLVRLRIPEYWYPVDNPHDILD